MAAYAMSSDVYWLRKYAFAVRVTGQSIVQMQPMHKLHHFIGSTFEAVWGALLLHYVAPLGVRIFQQA